MSPQVEVKPRAENRSLQNPGLVEVDFDKRRPESASRLEAAAFIRFNAEWKPQMSRPGSFYSQNENLRYTTKARTSEIDLWDGTTHQFPSSDTG